MRYYKYHTDNIRKLYNFPGTIWETSDRHDSYSELVIVSVTRNSSLHCFQNVFTRFWTNLFLFLGLNDISSVTQGANFPPNCLLR